LQLSTTPETPNAKIISLRLTKAAPKRPHISEAYDPQLEKTKQNSQVYNNKKYILTSSEDFAHGPSRVT